MVSAVGRGLEVSTRRHAAPLPELWQKLSCPVLSRFSPELPGAPSNLVISNISPRSATLQFRPGYDGKTSISRWLVEGQVRLS